jgi:uncharacterized RDD family membrane protein YckC
MTCSVNHATLATKFCPVCGGPAIASAPAAPPQSFTQPQWQQPAQQQWQQPASAGNFPAPLASRGKRLGGLLLDSLFIVLSTILLWLPYLIWLLIVMKDGQTPGKQVLKMRVYATTTNRPATWGHMAIRTILIPWLASFVYLPFYFNAINYGYLTYALTDPFYYANGWYVFGTFLSIGIFVVDLVLFFTSPLNQRISDRWAKTVVLDETPRWNQQRY